MRARHIAVEAVVVAKYGCSRVEQYALETNTCKEIRS